MVDVKTLRQRFGPGMAKQLRDEKKALEEAKTEGDPVCYWMEHPDIKSEARLASCRPICPHPATWQDYELVRIFDSMVYEDETCDEMSLGITARGELDSQQSREVLLLGFIWTGPIGFIRFYDF